jgi:hypothetical protein
MFAVEKYEVKQEAYSVAKEMIKAQGKYKAIGSGAYGTVYGSKDSKVVYKVGDTSNNVGYLSYIKVLSKQKKHNPYLPKIYGVRFIRSKSGDEVFVVAMEKLQPLKRGMGEVCDWFEDELSGYNRDSFGNAEAALGVKKIVPKPLTEALDVLRKAHSEGNSGRRWDSADWDLHCGNFMMRGPQVVVTDPLA